MMTTFTIAAELVPAARSGAYLDMHGALDEASTQVEAAGREEQPAHERYLDELARIDADRALLDELEWYASGEPTAVEIDLGDHHDALLGALRTQEEAERGHAESLPEDAEAVRDRAQENAASLAGAIRRIEETDVLSPHQGLPGLGIEHLILSLLFDRDHPGEWTRGELEEELHEETTPEVIAAALGRLRGAGAVVRDSDRVRLSRCVLFLNEIGIAGP
jgi:hypothetical protein